MSLSSGNSLAAGASAVTAGTVENTIKSKTDWSFVSKVDVSSTVSSVDLDLSNNYTTYKLIADQVDPSTSSYPIVRLLTAGGAITSGYGYSYYLGWTSATFGSSVPDSYVKLHTQAADWDKSWEFTFTTTTNNRRPIFRWVFASGTSTYDPRWSIGGGQLNTTVTTAITGIQSYMNTGNIDGGSFKLYGLNTHA